MVRDEQVCLDKILLKSLKGENFESNFWSKMLKCIKLSCAVYLYDQQAL